MRSLNKVTLLGHLGKDAEVRYTPSGVMVCNYSIATSRRWKDNQSGEWREETDWHAIQHWRCEKLSEYLKKGQPVFIEGRLQTRKWEKNGTTHYKTEVVVENLILLNRGQGQGSRSDAADDPGPSDHAYAQSAPVDESDDCPF